MDLGIISSENFYNLDVDYLLKYIVGNIVIEITSSQLSFIFIFLSFLIHSTYSGQ